MKKIQIIALLSALFMFAFGYRFLSSQGGNLSNTTDEDVMNVVVAAQDIAPYTTLTSDMFVVKRTVADAFLTNYYSSISDVVGSVSTSAIFTGDVLTSSRIVTEENPVLGLSAQLEDGKRAVTITVDTESGVANNLKVGNYVDVICVASVEATDGSKTTAGMYFTQIFGPGQPYNTQVLHETMGQAFSVIALQNIKIVAMDNIIDNTVAVQPPQYASITLEVTPAEAAKIALLNGPTAKIRLVLRPMEDSAIIDEPRDSILKQVQ